MASILLKINIKKVKLDLQLGFILMIIDKPDFCANIHDQTFVFKYIYSKSMYNLVISNLITLNN